jgi:hypothetical protein
MAKRGIYLALVLQKILKEMQHFQKKALSKVMPMQF